MKDLQYTITIHAPASKVYDAMLGLTHKKSYETWTAVFNPTSSYDGSWNKGDKILFIGQDEKGDKGGMVAKILDHQPNEFVSVQHVGLVKGNDEITSGPEVEQWANGLENYTFEPQGDATKVTVDIKTSEAFASYMNEKYPLALEALKNYCEQE